MAIRDWKKIHTNVWKKKNTSIGVDKLNISFKPDNYEVFLNRGMLPTSYKYFKTKSAALAYAKNYMRKH